MQCTKLPYVTINVEILIVGLISMYMLKNMLT